VRADLGATLAMGALAAAVAALPDVRRVAASGVNPGFVWLGLAGSTALVLGPLLVLVRAARSRVGTLRPQLVGVALAAAPVMQLGASLELHTHHRPLGAATFGVLSLVIVLACVVVTLRVFAWIASDAQGRRRFAARALVVLGAASVGLVVVRAAASEAYGRDAMDAARLLVVAALANGMLDWPRVAALARRVGVFAWALLVLVGLVVARGEVGSQIRERAPVLGGPRAWL
jgi:hypothetical protein